MIHGVFSWRLRYPPNHDGENKINCIVLALA
jgi:hypothetical protein